MQPLNATPATDAAASDGPAFEQDTAWLRRRIALVRSDLDDLQRSIYWTPGYGPCCTHIAAAIEHLKAARDASHHVAFCPADACPD